MKRRQFTQALAAACCSSALPLRAQDGYPNKPIRLLVPSTAGGGIDLLARMFAPRLSEQMGQPFVIENVGGAGGTIASGMLARSNPDGYTLMFQATTAAVNAASLTRLPFDAVNDLTPVAGAARFPLVMVINPSLPARNLPEFIALVKANPGKYSYGSAGSGTGTHLAAELFKLLAKVDMMHVPYKGTGAVVPDLIAGNVHALFDGLPVQSGYIKSSRLRPLGVTTTKRSQAMPDIPALSEVLPGYELPFWTGVFGPPKLPKVLVDRIAGEVQKALAAPQLSSRLLEFGAEAFPTTPAEFDRYWRQQVALYKRIIQDAHIKLEGN